MKRAQRIDGYRNSLQGTERERAARAQVAERRAREARIRLEELERYRHEYVQSLGRRVAEGMSGPALRDYHVFVARLDDAIQQQRHTIARCDSERDADQQRWREIAVQLKAVSAVIERWNDEERVSDERLQQREVDERALRMRRSMALEV